MLGLKSIDLEKEKLSALVIPVCEDADIHDNPKINNLIKKARELQEFKGEKDDGIIFYHPDGLTAERVIFLGIGKSENIDAETFRSFAGKAVNNCIKKQLTTVMIAAPCAEKTKIERSIVMEAMLEGAFLANHIFDKYKNEKKLKPLEQIDLFVEPQAAKQFNYLLHKTETICKGSLLAREWVSMPSNEKRPEQFAKLVAGIAEKAGLKVSVMDEKELKEKNCGAILAVASGSSSPPCMVIMEYRSNKAEKTIALVGKGITFDSGGINLKPGTSSRDMKIDMAGAAAVAATMITAASLKPGINIIGAFPLVENMPSGNSYRPGDIIRTHDGKTVEIGNTDAEGRMILIDTISYVQKTYKPMFLVDVATLTGACVVALGEKIAGVFSPDDELAKAIIEAGEKTYERCWRMPMPKDYKELLKSEIADINNVSESRDGGAITAALFLSEFVKDTRWAHIDIAGPVYIKKENSYCGAGGTGFGVRLFCNLLEKLL